jgi:glycosyltransferase involved in cell wall biosynthesis
MIDQMAVGGSERQFATLTRSLNPDSFQIKLGCLQKRGAFLDRIDQIAEFPLGGSFLTRQAHRARRALSKHLRANGVAVAHSFDFYSNLMLIPVARLAGVPVVIGSQRQMGDLLTPMQFRLQTALFRLCDRVTCNSRAAANRLIESGLRKSKVMVIPNALPDAAFDETAPALPRRPGVLRVSLIARMNNRVKNHDLFMHAAARLASKFPSVEFLLVGDGPLRQELEKLAVQLGIGARVTFMGERYDIPAVLAATDISVLPSSSESLPNAVLESMAAGVPVVATDVGGTGELIRSGETGLLVPPNNEVKLAEAIESLLESPALRVDYGRRGKQLAMAGYRVDHVRDQYEKLYMDLLREKRWRPRPHSSVPIKSEKSSQPVRVAIVGPSDRWIGGQGAQANLLLRNWKGDADVKPIFIPIDPVLPRFFSWVERIPFVRTMVRTPFYLAGLWRGMRDVEIAHIFSASYWSFLLAPVPAFIVARMRGKRILIHYHSGEARDHLKNWRTAVPVLRRADELVVPSQYLVDVFREFGLAPKIVPNTVDFSTISYRPRRPLRPFLVCTRGFEPYYSVDVVVQAFARVKKEFPSARLCLVGRGSLEQKIRDLVREIHLPDAEFAGAIPHQQIGRFYDQADIFINASWLDNMPVSILEAFASGTPVVSTAPEGIRYLVRHERTGLLSPPGDIESLAQNVIRLLKQPDFAFEIAQQAYEESHLYRWESVRDQWLEIYCSLAGREKKLEGLRLPRQLTTVGD